MPDKVLVVDFNNQVHRSNVTFGPPAKHSICVGYDDDGLSCSHKLLEDEVVHCTCGSRYDPIEMTCFGNRYLIIYNFFRNLRPLIELFNPVKCFIALEGHPQFRYDLFQNYKANRIIKQGAKTQESKDKFNESHSEIIRLLMYLPVTLCRATNYEADDVCGFLCEQLKDEDVTVISNDNDYLQLLQRGYPHCQIYNPIKKVFMVAPEWPAIAAKCLLGDKSDNIPSLLTPKKAEALLKNPQLFEQFLSVEENRAKFNMNRQLIEFANILPEEVIFQEGIHNFDELKSEFTRMEFRSIVNDASWEKFTKTFDCLRY